MIHVTPDDVRHFVPDIDLTGTRDESERLKAAHDAAAARGYRDLFIEGPVLAPSLAAVGQVLFRTRTGAGRLIGAYRKRVIPLSAPPALFPAGIHPRRHLPRFLSAMAQATAERPATIALLSDSWGMPNQRIAPTSSFVGALMRRLRQEFGPAARHIHLQNHAVGATRLLEATPPPQDVTGAAEGWFPAALTGFGADGRQPPDLLILLFGMNQGSYPMAADIAALDRVSAGIAACDRPPDLLYVANATPSSHSRPRGHRAAIEARDSYAGLIRARAAMEDRGLIDLGRALDMAHWGYDPTQVHFQRILRDAPVMTPYSVDAPLADLAVTLGQAADGPPPLTVGGTAISLTLSPIHGNALTLRLDADGMLIWSVRAAEDSDGPSGRVPATVRRRALHTIEIELRGPQLTVMANREILVDQPIPRGGGLFTPCLDAPDGPARTLFVESLAEGVPLLVQPWLTERDLWGERDGPAGGNGENHLAEPGRLALFDMLLGATRFA